jgi:hypothetical protein
MLMVLVQGKGAASDDGFLLAGFQGSIKYHIGKDRKRYGGVHMGREEAREKKFSSGRTNILINLFTRTVMTHSPPTRPCLLKALSYNTAIRYVLGIYVQKT